MPKIRRDLPGCGMHVHIGLTTADGVNAVEGDQALGLSELGACVVAGLLKHARGLAGLTAPTVNSYKRLLPGSWAPSHVCYGGSNRAALVRIPDAGTRHLEFRGGDGTGNPYLSLVGIMAAALDGIEEGRPATDPITDGLAGLTPADFAARGLVELPRSAPEALDALEADQVLMGALGPIIGPGFLRVRRSEAATYAVEVGDWERAAIWSSPEHPGRGGGDPRLGRGNQAGRHPLPAGAGSDPELFGQRGCRLRPLHGRRPCLRGGDRTAPTSRPRSSPPGVRT